MTKLIEDQQELAQWIRSVSGRLDMAVAFWGRGATEQFGLGRKDLDIRILLDLQAGGTNPQEVERLFGAAGRDRVKCLDRLHAKAYITPELVLIGSANASANGLGAEGFEATHWHELGLMTDDPQTIADAREWFDGKWENAKKITPQMLLDAKNRWALNRKNRAFTSPTSLDLLEAANAMPENFVDREIYIVVSIYDLDERGAAAEKARRLQTGQPAYGFQSWPDIPLDATLICFTHSASEGFQADDPMVCFTEKVGRRSLMKWVTPSISRRVDGYRVQGIRYWRKRLNVAMSLHRKCWKKQGGMCQRLDQFMHATNC